MLTFVCEKKIIDQSSYSKFEVSDKNLNSNEAGPGNKIRRLNQKYIGPSEYFIRYVTVQNVQNLRSNRYFHLPK